jgi:hypothetical protein
MLGYVYGGGSKYVTSMQFIIDVLPNLVDNQKLNPKQDMGIKIATPVGTLVGQLLFGWLADIVGRKKMCK